MCVCIKQTDQIILITSVSSDSHSYTFRILYSLSTADKCVLLATNAGNFKAHGKDAGAFAVSVLGTEPIALNTRRTHCTLSATLSPMTCPWKFNGSRRLPVNHRAVCCHLSHSSSTPPHLTALGLALLGS